MITPQFYDIGTVDAVRRSWQGAPESDAKPNVERTEGEFDIAAAHSLEICAFEQCDCWRRKQKHVAPPLREGADMHCDACLLHEKPGCPCRPVFPRHAHDRVVILGREQIGACRQIICRRESSPDAATIQLLDYPRARCGPQLESRLRVQLVKKPKE